MYQQEVTIINKSGLHARPAAEFARAASLFRSSVSILHKDQTINAKSIINILAGGIIRGSRIVIRAEGPDEIIAVETLASMVESGIGETAN
ncbi:HPr family phosphocarrier protein [Sinanaerobacter chloroacetimidivorans]|uniref:Phosphocarrier protein HPr n=1 Tax=Sinanaerobacter chloroacetimidivorans TaxID=2818044 RepID=A0A8J7W487_9FIRM|nr:HPr family phosphocarrier protein [Sinanaerobacter chloroacetimidivorans]MBR0600584.1 HPr family phosphocarrier protein [Sinanaerobacter chloroacetimidivorans]